jgi:uncharacterized protein YjbI with pentapeptide repeats
MPHERGLHVVVVDGYAERRIGPIGIHPGFTAIITMQDDGVGGRWVLLNFRSPTALTVIGIALTLVVTAAVVVVLLQFGGGAEAVSDNAALIGALVALGGVFTNQLVNNALEDQRARGARKAEQEHRERALNLQKQRAQEDALQTYINDMGYLLLNREMPLRQSEEDSEARTLARARTLTVLLTLDGDRKRSVVQFLHESLLIDKYKPVVSLTFADLREANLSGADLDGADLRGADLSKANLSGADLNGANLNLGDLREATLSKANLIKADLSEAGLSEADLSEATLLEADLSEALLRGANLYGAHGWTEAQLTAAKSLEGATMPDGRKYEDWIKDSEGSKDAEYD